MEDLDQFALSLLLLEERAVLGPDLGLKAGTAPLRRGTRLGPLEGAADAGAMAPVGRRESGAGSKDRENPSDSRNGPNASGKRFGDGSADRESQRRGLESRKRLSGNVRYLERLTPRAHSSGAPHDATR